MNSPNKGFYCSNQLASFFFHTHAAGHISSAVLNVKLLCQVPVKTWMTNSRSRGHPEATALTHTTQ